MSGVQASPPVDVYKRQPQDTIPTFIRLNPISSTTIPETSGVIILRRYLNVRLTIILSLIHISRGELIRYTEREQLLLDQLEHGTLLSLNPVSYTHL